MGLNNKRVLGVIPAKGKSTRLPRKNVIDFCGKPMIAWTIEAALHSGVIDDLIVSTEDDEIAEVAKAFGASVPFIRDDRLSVDPAGVEIVTLDAIAKLEELGSSYEKVVILLPTSPLRLAGDIVSAMQLFDEKRAKSLMSVCQYDHSPYSAYQADGESLLTPVFPDMNRKKSQELPPAYRCNGAIHILDVAFFKETKSYTCEPLLKYEMPRSRSADIDTEDDYYLAEHIFHRVLRQSELENKND